MQSKLATKSPLRGYRGASSVAIGDTDTFLVLSRAFANCSFELLLLPFLHFWSSSYSIFFFKTHKRRYSIARAGNQGLELDFSSAFVAEAALSRLGWLKRANNDVNPIDPVSNQRFQPGHGSQ